MVSVVNECCIRYVPLPTSQTMLLVKTGKDSSGDKSCKGTGYHVTRIEDGQSDSEFFAGVEHAKNEQGSRIKLRKVRRNSRVWIAIRTGASVTPRMKRSATMLP